MDVLVSFDSCSSSCELEVGKVEPIISDKS